MFQALSYPLGTQQKIKPYFHGVYMLLRLDPQFCPLSPSAVSPQTIALSFDYSRKSAAAKGKRREVVITESTWF